MGQQADLVDEIDFGEQLMNDHDLNRARLVLSKLHQNPEEIDELYFSCKRSSDPETDPFERKVERISKYVQLRTISKIQNKQFLMNPGNMSFLISSIEFDKDDEFFASAGVEKKVQIYDHSQIINSDHERGLVSARELQKQASSNSITPPSSVASMLRRRSEFSRQHSNTSIAAPLYEQDAEEDEFDMLMKSPLPAPGYPIKEIYSSSKLSCISWNPYIKNQIAGSDYDGIVHLWDTASGKETLKLQEHEKRTWTVDYSVPNPTMLCSAGDDCKVKIWTTNLARSVDTIATKAAVCSVKFNPTKRYELAFGSADHKIYYYDLRNTRSPLFAYAGHPKAVSYVRFFSETELLSASTDCTLRTWKVPGVDPFLHEETPIKTEVVKLHEKQYQGHKNEKNFVGLSISKCGTYIATGSEDNSMYIYSKELSRPWIVTPVGHSTSLKV